MKRLQDLPAAWGFISVIFIFLALSLSMPATTFSSHKQLNVLFITVDTLRSDRLSCYEPSHVSTPFIDSLAARGAVFTRTFSHVPLTLPAHTCIFTGKTPPAHGVRDNGRFRASDNLLTLAEYLKEQGYATGAFIGGYPLHSRFGLNQGFELYDDRLEEVSGIGREFAEVRAGIVADRALTWLKNRRSPWFLWVHFYDPHDPYEPPEPYRTRFKNSPYDGEVAYVDENVGRLLAFLQDTGLTNDTLIILTGDHGESLGDHGELTHGFLTYNSTLWVPLIIAVPGQKHSTVNQIVSHIDIFPTLCELLSIRRPAGLEGHSLVPALTGRKLSSELVYFECLYPYYSKGWAPIQGHITGQWKFIDSPIPELYDLGKDFQEKVNLVPNHDLSSFRKVQEKLNQESGLSGTSGSEQKLEAAAIEKLRSLGYMVGPAAPKKKSFSPRDDVKVILPYYEKAMETLALSSSGQRALAIEKLKEVITARPDLDVSYVNLALIYETAGQIEEAREILLGALKSLPESYDIFTHTIGFFIASGEYKEAVSLAESRYLPQMDADPKIWVDLGLCYRHLSDFTKARAAYERATAIDPTYSVVHNNLGTLYLAMYMDSRDESLLTKSITCFERALELTPDYAAAYYGLGLAYYRAGKFDLSISALKQATRLNPDLADAFFYLGVALYKEKRYAEALSPLKTYRVWAEKNLSVVELRKLDEIIGDCQERK